MRALLPCSKSKMWVQTVPFSELALECYNLLQNLFFSVFFSLFYTHLCVLDIQYSFVPQLSFPSLCQSVRKDPALMETAMKAQAEVERLRIELQSKLVCLYICVWVWVYIYMCVCKSKSFYICDWLIYVFINEWMNIHIFAQYIARTFWDALDPNDSHSICTLKAMNAPSFHLTRLHFLHSFFFIYF